MLLTAKLFSSGGAICITSIHVFFVGAGWIRAVRYSPNGLLIACGMGGETTDPIGGRSGSSKRHSPREEDGTIKIVSGERLMLTPGYADAVIERQQ